MIKMDKFICPVCKEPLVQKEKSLVCQNRHTFDISKYGYVNLLSGGGGNHGDSREMIKARQDFLSKGYYQSLADAISEQFCGFSKKGDILLDAGCGDCYYSKYIGDRLLEKDIGAQFICVDVSKEATRFGARHFKAAQTACASVYALPLADNSVDGVLSVFSPMAKEEFLRVLKPGGHLVIAGPGARHLWSLKAAVYDEPYENTLDDFALEGFTLAARQSLDYTIHLNSNKEIKDLFSMTPYSHKTSKEDIAKLDKLESLTTEVCFEIAVYKK